MGVLDATLLTACRSNPGGVRLVFELTLPDSTRKWSLHGDLASASGGQHYGKVLTCSPIRRSVLDRDGRLESTDVTLTIDDTDKTFAALVEGSLSKSVRGSACAIKLAHVDVASSNWSALKTGILKKWPQPEPFQYALVIGDDDVVLRRDVPRVRITRADWPNAAEGVIGQAAPLVIGKHSSIAQDDAGSVPLMRVDAAGFRYAVSLGRSKAVDRVYVDGAEVATGWTASVVTVGGRTWQIVTFATDPGQDAVITADVQGVEATGDGSGALVEEPAAELKTWLINHVYAEYRTGNWATSHARVDATSFTSVSSFFTAFSAKGGVLFDRLRDGIEWLNDWALSWYALLYWTTTGKVAVGVLDHRTTDLASGPLWDWATDEQDPAQSGQEDEGVVTVVTGSYGGGRQSLVVMDPSVTTDDAVADVALVWGPQFVV